MRGRKVKSRDCALASDLVKARLKAPYSGRDVKQITILAEKYLHGAALSACKCN